METSGASPAGRAPKPAGASGAARVAWVGAGGDGPGELDGLLGPDVVLSSAASADDGLALLGTGEPAAAVVSDLRPLEPDGAWLLEAAHGRHPDTVRVLLASRDELEAAVAVANQADVFRLLLRPCPAPVLRRALLDALGQHRTLVAARELLEQTLRASIAALVDLCALANPLAFARATRIRRIVDELVELHRPPDAWRIEVAAMLAQIGTLELPRTTVVKLQRGLPLDRDEQHQVDDLPQVANRILASIPHLGDVRRIIRDQTVAYDRLRQVGGPLDSETSLGARMLHLATDLDRLEAGGAVREDALVALAARPGAYDPGLLAALAAKTAAGRAAAPRPVGADELHPGLTIAKDVLDGAGRLVIGRGYVVTESVLAHLHNWRGPAIQEPIFVTEPPPADP